MKIPLNRKVNKSIYLQIYDYLQRLINSGALKPGDRLPSIRDLAKNSQINKLTVIQAYNLLEAEGLIVARQGSGYFVNNQCLFQPKITSNFAPQHKMVISREEKNSFVDLYQISAQVKNQPGMIDFSSGFTPISDLKVLQSLARRAMKGIPNLLFDYDLAQGQLILRQQIAQMLLQQGLQVSPEHIVITNGSTQALYLAFNYFLKAGDWVIVESPTYHGAIDILENLNARIIDIPMTAAGMDLELLEKYLDSHRPQLIYTMSSIHNPTGLTTSLAHRQQLLALATKYQCQIIEDNAYEGLNFEPVPAPIKALDKEDLVIYVGTFSKTLMPGLRVGYMVITPKHYQALLKRKLLNDLHVSTVSQAIVSEYLSSGHYRHHLNHLREIHLFNRNVMLLSLENHFPSYASWTVPQGGLFLWVDLPEITNLSELCNQALAQNVLVSPGDCFFPAQSGYKAIRLNFSFSPEIIERGISILGKLLKKVENGAEQSRTAVQAGY